MTIAVGVLLIALPVLALFAFIARVDGLRTALTVFGVVLGLAASVASFVVGLTLLAS